MPVMYPIALDLGAKTTGVFNLRYASGTQLSEFQNPDLVTKRGFVARAPSRKEGGYQLMQADRTFTRHAYRGNARRRQSKELLYLILKTQYEFNVDAHKPAIAHFMNRRGFNYNESEVNFSKLTKITTEQWLSLQHFLVERSAPESLYQLDVDNAAELLPSLSNEELSELSECIQKHPNESNKSPFTELLKVVQEIKKERSTGAKHRTEYFEAVTADVNNLPSCKYPQFKKLGNALRHAKGFKQGEFVNVFLKLIFHINNFDLKLLNRIHKDLTTTEGKQNIDEILARHVSHWIMKLWQASPSNGEKRLADIREIRTRLKEHCSKNPNKIIHFLLNTDPKFTIAPYESHKNRRPPYCQTLVLNVKTLDSEYSEWRTWLDTLTAARHDVSSAVENYTTQLRSALKRRPDNISSDIELDARALQFILDTTAKIDPFSLSSIWGLSKKIKQLKRNQASYESVKDELKKLLQNSHLPKHLKDEFSEYPPLASFWHFVNRYYQTRRKARAGRYFIHRDNRQQSERKKWHIDGLLMQVCIHRPRQLKHQGLQDTLAILGVSKALLADKLNTSESLLTIEALRDIIKANVKGIVGLCEEARKAQKEYGADLKAYLDSDPRLIALKLSAQEKAQTLANWLTEDDELRNWLIERTKSVFVFAQLHQTLFAKDRSGFSKTCPICSADNGARMQPKGQHAHASRLSTLSLRLIDGALKKLLNHKAHHVANRLWPDLEAQLESDECVAVPIIVEQNRFDFNDNLRNLKGKKKDPNDNEPRDVTNYQNKQERIVAASLGICPYTGKTLSNSDVDHIIPRSGRFGTLNDEANLIAASEDGNRKIKGSREYTLKDLDEGYLTRQFGTSDTQKIKIHLQRTLWNETTGQFHFGTYKQFIALDNEQQKAFRHALFLNSDEPLRQAVIKAIKHATKSSVNGTQRFFAQLLADILWTKAKKIGRAPQISFDYFEYSANPSDEISTTSLRRELERWGEGSAWDITSYRKLDGRSQKDYSHVIDAMCAMALAIEQHPNEGAMQLDCDGLTVWPYVNPDTGEFLAGSFHRISVSKENLEPPVIVAPVSELKRVEKFGEQIRPHQLLSRRAFGENQLGLRFYDLIIEGNEVVKGFLTKQGDDFTFNRATEKSADTNTEILDWWVSNGGYRVKRKDHIMFYQPQTKKLLTLMFEALNNAKEQINPKDPKTKAVKWLFGKGDGQLFYYVSSTLLKKAPRLIAKFNDIKARTNPMIKRWHAFYKGWRSVAPGGAEERENEFVIASSQQSEWDRYCKAFLNWTDSILSHRSEKEYTMLAPGTSQGKLVLQKKADRFSLWPINNGNVSEDVSLLLIKNSPTLVAFKKEILSKGYLISIKEKKDFSGQTIIPSRIFDEAFRKDNKSMIKKISIVATTNNLITVQGLCVNWFAENLLKRNEEDPEAWKTRRSFLFDKYDNQRCSIRLDRMKEIFSFPFVAEDKKTVLIAIEGGQLSLGLRVKRRSQMEKLVVVEG